MSARRPNLVIITTDQQRFDALSRHGGLARTPRLDRLAAEGADLQGHFANAPVCVPSRCSLYTGRYPHAHGVMENDSRLGRHEEHLFATLKSHGYRLGYFGKNHLLAEGETHGFDRFLTGEEPGTTPGRRAYQELERAALGRLATIGSWASAEYHDHPDEATTTGVITDAALHFLKESAGNDRPYCLTVSLYDPHVPHLAPRRFASLFPEDAIALPALPPHGLSGKQPRLRIKREAQRCDAATAADRRRYLALYAAMCSFVDEQVGRLLDAVARRQDAADTIVVFASDHGDFCFHYDLCKKDLVLLDDLLHVPCIIHWPGRIAPRVVADALTEHVDLMPTLLDLLGIAIPGACQGISIAPLLTGNAAHHKEAVFAEVCYSGMKNPYSSFADFHAAWQSARSDPSHPLHRSAVYNIPGEPTKCVRTREWKYIWCTSGIEELYDLRHDPAEWHNLANSPQHADILAQLRRQLGEWHMRTEDSLSPSKRRLLASRPGWQTPAAAD